MHLVSPLLRLRSFFWDGFLIFFLSRPVAAFFCSVPWQFFFIFPAFIPHCNIERPKKKKMHLFCWNLVISNPYMSHSLSLLLSVYFSLLFSPHPTGDGSYSCPETAALHHSQCKSHHALLPPLSPSLFGVMPLHQCVISQRNMTSATSASDYQPNLLYHTCSPFLSFILSLAINLIPPSPAPTPKLFFLILLIHSKILLFSFVISYHLPPKSMSDPETHPFWMDLTPLAHPLTYVCHPHHLERDPQPHAHQRRDGPPAVCAAGAHLQPAGGPHDDQDGSPGPGGGDGL